MGWIKNRILSEWRKYEGPNMDWAKIAEAKIKSQIDEALYKWQHHEWYGDLNKQISDENLNYLKELIFTSQSVHKEKEKSK